MIFYFLITAFVAGMFVGSIIESKERPELAGFAILMLIAIFWPFMIFVYAKDYLESRK